MKDLTPTLFSLAELLERMSINYVVMGGLAVRAYAIPRATEDIDFTLAIGRERLPELFDALKAQDYAVPEPYQTGWVDQLNDASKFCLVKLKRYLDNHSIDVDLFLAESPFQQEILRRRQLADVEGRRLWIASAEDLVLLKLAAGRPRDWIDVADVFFTQGPLDETYMARWAVELGIADRLERALSEQHDERP